MYYVFAGLGFFSTIVTLLELLDQPKGGKRMVKVNNLCENINVPYYSQGFQRICSELKFCTYYYIIVAEFAVFQSYISSGKTYLPITSPE